MAYTIGAPPFSNFQTSQERKVQYQERKPYAEDAQDNSAYPTLKQSFRIEALEDKNIYRNVHVMRILNSPEICVIPNCLTPSECRDLIKLAEPYWQPSLTSVGRALGPQKDFVAGNSQTRTSWSSRLAKGVYPLVSKIECRVAVMASCPIENIEPLVVVRYQPSQYFNDHHDGFFRPKTVLIYLNDDFEQGETEFKHLGLKIKPQTGMAMIWSNVHADGTPDSRLIHAGRAPRGGIKYAVNCFVNEESQMS